MLTWRSTSHCDHGDPGTGHTVTSAGDLNLKQREEATLDKTQAVTDAVDGEQGWPCCWYSELTVSRDTEQITPDSGYLPAFWIIRPGGGGGGGGCDPIMLWGMRCTRWYFTNDVLCPSASSPPCQGPCDPVLGWTTRPSLLASRCADGSE